MRAPGRSAAWIRSTGPARCYSTPSIALRSDRQPQTIARGQPDAKKPYRYLGSPVLSVAALPPLQNGVNITSDLIKVRKIVTGEQSQHHAQGLQAALIVLAGALQILR